MAARFESQSAPLGRVIMVQGTSSHAGKSTLVAGLCRILSNTGLSVAPFKAQNMSLNSAVTPDRAEIGRAQMLQAQAARVVPIADMNPVLLKPQGESTSQVVVLGKVHAVRTVREYYSMRQELWPVVTNALARLRAEHDVVVIEGAGSPAEINLRDRDITNMSIALHARAPVILVGDIERGGVFASLVGTVALLTDEERALIRGFVINKFRGDISLIDPGPDMLQQRTGIPTLGVLPYMHDIHLPEEDSLGISNDSSGDSNHDGSRIHVAVLRFPHIANFDDLDPLRRDPRVQIRYIDNAASLGTPDVIILPGSKTTVSDLQWAQKQGIATEVMRCASNGVPVIGLCGGFQMLGKSIQDPHAVESAAAMVQGLGILSMDTIFHDQKVTRQARGSVQASRGLLVGCEGMSVTGYEIHMGTPKVPIHDHPLSLETGDRALSEGALSEGALSEGALSDDGWVFGTYLHGLFHNAELREQLLYNIAKKAGKPFSKTSASYDLDCELDKLADCVTSHLDMQAIYRMLNV